ncbi:MAG: riboflavin biosynthesis protein RibF [Lachnospiraceae bacterium]|nr:riboflavin biosynthesis protein RibF [Lachnospiraceae bacterium]
MIIIKGTEFQLEEPSAVVLGKFDGVHVGHRVLLRALMEQKEKGLKTVVFTFDKPPASLFTQSKEPYRELYTLEEKRRIFTDMGVDVLIEFPMNQETAAIPAEEFITEILQKSLMCSVLIAGEDVCFGRGGLGNRLMLEAYSAECGFEVMIFPKLLIGEVIDSDSKDVPVSSTYIRQCVNAGFVANAKVLLQGPFHLTGVVEHGAGMGSKVFDMPTANIKWPENKVLPAFGVYYTKVFIDESMYSAITNVGRKPTVAGEKGEILAETYIYDFQGDLYGRTISVQFHEFVRAEKSFDDIEALKRQLKQDLQKGSEYWNA